MALKDVFQQFLNDVEWEDEIAHDDSDDTDFISTGCQIDSQRYRLKYDYLRESSDDQNFARLSIWIAEDRAREAAFVLNDLNLRMGYGNLEMAEDGAGLNHRWALDVEGATASPEQFGNLIGAASCL